MTIKPALRLSAAVAALLCGAPLLHAAESVLADSAADTADAGDAAEQRRSDIVVTGLHQGEGQNKEADNGALGSKSLLDTPYSITVVGKEDISKRQANTIAQIFVNDPSVFSFATAGTTNWWGTQIRGLGVRNYYIDDVPLLLYWGGDFPLESVESVEALKGLSGFMYGFGAPGGTIAYRTKRPTAEPLLTTEVGYRTKSDFYAHVDAGGPLTDDGRLGYRINIAGEKGTLYNEAGANRWLGSLALTYAISPDVDWYATATYEDSKLEHEPFQIYWSGYEGAILPKPTYDYDKLNVDNSYYKARTLATATGVDWRFADGWKAKLTYGYTSKLHHSNKMFVNMVNRAGDYEGNAYNFAELDKSHFVQAMVQGEFETGPVRHAIVAGASYMVNDSYFGANSYWGHDFDGNIYENQDFRVTRDIDWSTKGSPTRERQRALFLSDTLYLGDHVQAIVGGRYTRYKLLDTDSDPATDGGYRTSKLSPTFALILKPAPWASIYGSYVESLEPGSRVGGQYANAGQILSPTVSRQYEAGVKVEHDGLSLTGAAFRVERANTAERFVAGEDRPYLRQDGETLYKGLELIASYRIGRDLKLGAGVIRLDPSLRKLSETADGTPSPDIGNIPAQAAKWQLTGNAEYAVAGIDGLSLHANVRYFGKAPTDDANRLFIPRRTLANAGFQYRTQIGGQGVTFTGNLNNLFNKKYWGLGNIGEARNGSLSVRIDW
ncbi:iron complex outermembrane receptor protein [Sphingopyxis panaciterrae]|uniref:TonB-dependent siderophore receptor n=1 Tax=Sphingopyxis panaciterrae TaxID=363841 RepID=UPI001421015B|nr:TonB-dependent siderophore receptor [Sphingopyxis panaciterrae]NIJ38497.1 iron complex outermembrane receptor protein [Sphingopyxis panaciterrae]